MNASDVALQHIDIRVYDHVFSKKQLEAGECFSFSYKPKWESEYVVSWEYENGRKFTDSVGYISSGLNHSDAVIFKGATVGFESN